jgi:CheY-like chemotaxis protein
LPIVISSISEEKKTGESAIQTNLNASSHLILVAEDEEAVRQMCVKLLKKQGFRVIEATNGEEALELFNANADRISLMIFDVMMPKMTGKMAYDQIRKINKTIPTIFCTGYSDEVLKAELNGQANVILLDKPYKTTKLLETIYKLLTRS